LPSGRPESFYACAAASINFTFQSRTKIAVAVAFLHQAAWTQAAPAAGRQ